MVNWSCVFHNNHTLSTANNNNDYFWFILLFAVDNISGYYGMHKINVFIICKKKLILYINLYNLIDILYIDLYNLTDILYIDLYNLTVILYIDLYNLTDIL